MKHFNIEPQMIDCSDLKCTHCRILIIGMFKNEKMSIENIAKQMQQTSEWVNSHLQDQMRKEKCMSCPSYDYVDKICEEGSVVKCYSEYLKNIQEGK